MRISRRTSYKWTCPACDLEQQTPVWLIVDSREHETPIHELQGLAVAACLRCGVEMSIDSPVLVIRPGTALPLLHGIGPSEWADCSQSLRAMSEALDGLGVSSTVAPGELFPPLVAVPRFLLPIVLNEGFDFTPEVTEAVEGSIRAVAGETAANMYQLFVALVRETEHVRLANKSLSLLSAVTPDELVDFIEANPAVYSEEAVKATEEWAASFASEGEGSPPASRLRLLRSLAAGAAPAEAVAAFMADLDAFGGGVMRPRLAEIIDSLNSDDSPQLAALADEALALSRAFGDLGATRWLLGTFGARLLQGSSDQDQEAIERAVEFLEEARSIVIPETPLPAMVLVNLGTAYARRTKGDPDLKWSRARDCFEEAISLATAAGEDATLAMGETNLAYCLLNFDKGAVSATDILDHAREGLRLREPADAIGVGYACLILGLSYEHRGRPADIERARTHFEQGLSKLSPKGDRSLFIALQNAYADCLLKGENVGASELSAAKSALNASLHAVPEGGDPGLEARARWIAARAAEAEQGPLCDEGLELRRQALALFDPAVWPQQHLDVGGELLDHYFQLGRWEDSAQVARTMLAAFDTKYRVQTTNDGRKSVIAAHPRLFRWASYLQARAGHLVEAVETIERGRAQQLATDLARETVDLKRLRHVDDSLATAYVAAIASYRQSMAAKADALDTSAAVATSQAASVRLQELIDQIREIPGFDSFLRPMQLEQIAVADGERPLIYVVSAPAGTFVIGVEKSARDGRVAVHARDLPTITSATVTNLLLVDPETVRPGLTLAQANRNPEEESVLDEALDRVCERLRPLAEAIVEVASLLGTDQVVLVPTGFLGLIPLHAIRASASHCLDDELDIALAPSAAVHQACRTRAIQTGEGRHLVGLADTKPDGERKLRGSVAELQTIARLETWQSVTLEYGHGATIDWIKKQADQASHLHFACHGGSSLLEPGGGILELADANLTTEELQAWPALRARTVVASACQSGHYDTSASPDEILGLASGFLRSGAASAVVSLWPVFDEATALLMSKFYEVLLAEPASLRPASALRVARIWLRDLTEKERDRYLAAHPHLSEALRSQGVPLRRGDSPTGTGLMPAVAWAPFLAWGA